MVSLRPPSPLATYVEHQLTVFPTTYDPADMHHRDVTRTLYHRLNRHLKPTGITISRPNRTGDIDIALGTRVGIWVLDGVRPHQVKRARHRLKRYLDIYDHVFIYGHQFEVDELPAWQALRNHGGYHRHPGTTYFHLTTPIVPKPQHHPHWLRTTLYIALTSAVLALTAYTIVATTNILLYLGAEYDWIAFITSVGLAITAFALLYLLAIDY